MKSVKAIPFVFISLLCSISIAWLYLPFPPWFTTTHLLFFEFPPFSLSILSRMVCVLLVGIFLGTMARRYAAQAESKLQRRFAAASIFLNAIILILPVLNLISMFTPRMVTRAVDFKIGRYVCVTAIEAEYPGSQEVDYDENTVVYEQGQKGDQDRKLASVDAIQPGQVVEIRYIDNDNSPYGEIKARSITILRWQHRPYKNENCGNALP